MKKKIFLSNTEKILLSGISAFHLQYLKKGGDYKSVELFNALHKLRPNGAISGYSQTNDSEIENEWLLDFYWYKPLAFKSTNESWMYFSGLDLACEVEWWYPTETNFSYLLTDLQKLMAIKANTYLFITQLKKETNLEVMIDWLQDKLCMPDFRCLFIVLPVHTRKDNELRAFLILNNQFHVI